MRRFRGGKRKEGEEAKPAPADDSDAEDGGEDAGESGAADEHGIDGGDEEGNDEVDAADIEAGDGGDEAEASKDATQPGAGDGVAAAGGAQALHDLEAEEDVDDAEAAAARAAAQLALKAKAEAEKMHAAAVKELFRAAKNGNPEALQLALKGVGDGAARMVGGVGPTTDAEKVAFTPLLMAASGEGEAYVACIDHLMEAGADVNAATGHGWTALHIAAFWGRPDVALRLLQWGADPRQLDGSGRTALAKARFRKHEEVAVLLEEWGGGGGGGPHKKSCAPHTNIGLISRYSSLRTRGIEKSEKGGKEVDERESELVTREEASLGEERNGDVQQILHGLTGRRTVPNIFVRGRSIGGGDEVAKMQRSGELASILKEAGCDFE
eukprot:g1682.t1